MNTEELVRGIKEDTSSGASEIMKKTVECLLLMSNSVGDENPEEYFNTMIEFGRELILAQPAMAPVFNAVNTMLLVIESGVEEGNPSGELNQRVLTATKDISSSSLEAMAKIQKEVVELIADGQTVLTHSYSSTVISSLLLAKSEGKDFDVMVTESRPLFEGRRTAQLLSDAGIKVTLIADMAVFYYLHDCALIMTGCDCLCHNGVVNKIGTKGLALAASEHEVPFFIVSEMNKALPAKYRLEPEITVKDPNELWDEPGDIAVRNLYFDITPHSFFKGFITEDGNLGTSEILEMIEQAVVCQCLTGKWS